MKFKFGSISNDYGETKDITVKVKFPTNIKDTLIGVGMIACGVTYLMIKSFKNGGYSYEKAELNTLDDLGLID